MVSEFYIFNDNVSTGPFDTLSLLRKVRKGEFTPNTLVAKDSHDEPQAAREFIELSELFNSDSDTETIAPLEPFRAQPIRIGTILKQGADGFLSHQSIALFFAVLLIIVAGTAILLTPLFGAHIALPIVAPLALTSIMLLSAIALRHARRRPMGLEQFNMILGNCTLPNLFVSLTIGVIAISLPLILSTSINPIFAFTSFLLSPLLALHSFTPFYIADHPELSTFEAMQRSREAILYVGTPAIIALCVLWCMMLVTYSTALLALLFIPIAVTGLAEYYEAHLSA